MNRFVSNSRPITLSRMIAHGGRLVKVCSVPVDEGLLEALNDSADIAPVSLAWKRRT
jgi:hypothetical protein